MSTLIRQMRNIFCILFRYFRHLEHVVSQAAQSKFLSCQASNYVCRYLRLVSTQNSMTFILKLILISTQANLTVSHLTLYVQLYSPCKRFREQKHNNTNTLIIKHMHAMQYTQSTTVRAQQSLISY